MTATMEDLRRATCTALAGAGAAAAAVGLAFWVVLQPAESVSCNTALLDSAFKTALAPVHVAAAAVLSACLLVLSRGRPTAFALGAVWAGVLAGLAVPAVFAPFAVAGAVLGPTLGPLALLVLLVRTVLLERSSAPPEQRWADHARTAQILLWGALLVGLPASYAHAWLSGASFFCF
jgi:uncharacterized membrane protein